MSKRVERYWVVFYIFTHKNGQGTGVAHFNTEADTRREAFLNQQDLLEYLSKGNNGETFSNVVITGWKELDKAEYDVWSRKKQEE